MVIDWQWGIRARLQTGIADVVLDFSMLVSLAIGCQPLSALIDYVKVVIISIAIFLAPPGCVQWTLSTL